MLTFGGLFLWGGIKPNEHRYLIITMEISNEKLTELTSIIEDTVEYACDQWMLSGELAWSVLECLAIAKQAELQGLVTADQEAT